MKKLAIFYFILLLNQLVLATSIKDYQFISPMPGSDFNTRESTIIIRQGSLIDPASLKDELIQVNGENSGIMSGQFFLSRDQRSLIFKPAQPFVFGEIVKVKLTVGIRARNGDDLPDCEFSFQIQPSINLTLQSQELPNHSMASLQPLSSKMNMETTGLPKITSVIYDSASIGAGKLLLSCYGQLGLNFKGDPNDSAYVMVLNNDGSVWKIKNIGSTKGVGLTDFKMQPNGWYSYPKVLKSYPWTGGGEVIHMVMNDQFAVIDSFQMGNGYVAETHDFRLLANGHALLLGYYLIPVDLSQYVTGGRPDAFIDGALVQELDSDKNVVFQWRSWDYFEPNRIPWMLIPNNTQQIVNVFHLNTISLDTDNNLLLGTPAMGLKVSRQTGQVLWSIGGFINQFTFTNVSLPEGMGDFGGHTFQRLDNGNFMVYNNSPFPWQSGANTISSNAVEYSLDETNKTATRVWAYSPNPIVSGWHAGSVQRLPNGNTVIGWGGPPTHDRSLIMTEVTPNGSKVMELYFESDKFESYRVFRMPVNTGASDTQVTVAEVAPGNIYNFNQGDSVDTGIRIKVNSYEGSGYNQIKVVRYYLAPQNADFFGKAPQVITGRAVTSQIAIVKLDGDIRFNVDKWNIRDPEHTLVYYREFENTGLFLPLTTNYNPVTHEVIGNIDNFGEFILAVPDIQSIVFTPKPSYPPDSGSVNQTLPVVLRWNPRGYVNSYALQVAKDVGFTQLVVDEMSLTDALFKLSKVDNNTTYFWRVKSENDIGQSDWCPPVSFRTIPPAIALITPNGGESWQRGLPQLIRWQSNVIDPIILALYHQDSVISVIDTVASGYSYNWEIDPYLAIGLYQIKITDLRDSSLFDFSDAAFAIIDTVTAINDFSQTVNQFALYPNFPNPFNSSTTIKFSVPNSAFVTLKIYNNLGQEIIQLVSKEMKAGVYTTQWNASDLSSGVYYYRLTVGKLTDTKKLVLIK